MKRYIILVFSTRTILSLSYFRKRNLVGSPPEDPFQSPSENPFKLRIFHAPFSFQLLIRSNKKIASGELGILPPLFPYTFVIKSNKESAPESSGPSLLPFPFNFLLETIRKLLRNPPEPLVCFFLTDSY